MYNHEAGTVLFYQNGEVVTGQGMPEESNWDCIYIGTTTEYPPPGGICSEAYEWSLFHGAIDEVFIFGTALTPTQLDAIYQQGATAIMEIATQTASHAPPQSRDKLKYSFQRLIGISEDTALMATRWRPDNVPPMQPAQLTLVDASDPTNIKAKGTY